MLTVRGTRRGRVPSCRPRPGHGGLARKASSVVRACTCARRSLARRSVERRAREAGIPGKARRRIASRTIAGGDWAASGRGSIARERERDARGFTLAPRQAREIVVLAPPVEDQHAAVIAFLADGEAWSSSALALALGASARTVQRALDSLATAGKVQSYWPRASTPLDDPAGPGFTTTLLLPGPLPSD